MERPASHLLLALEALVGAPCTGTTGLVRPSDYRRCFLCAPFLPGSVCGGGKSRLAFVKLERRAHRGGNFNLLDLPNGWTAMGPLLRVSLFFLFGLMNLFLFQPYIWDNTKILTWASLGISGLAAYTLHALWVKKAVMLAVKHARTHQRPVFMFHLFRAVLGRTLIILL